MVIAKCAAPAATISSAPWGTMPDGRHVTLYTLSNKHGVTAKITNYGGIIQSLCIPDRKGASADVVLGFDDLAGYEKSSPYFGAIVGRYANRIARGRFVLDGKPYQLVVNDGVNSLHGGKIGFDKVLWTARPRATAGVASLALTYVSKNREQGYPGTLTAHVVYTLAEDNTLRIDYTAATDCDTIVNLSNHTYWNLAQPGTSVLAHVLTLNASHYTPIDAKFIPTGEIAPVDGTPFDFRAGDAIGARVGDNDEQLKRGLGYDHNFVLDRAKAGDLEQAATIYEPTTGREVNILTTEPGVQFYCGNFLDGKVVGKGGKAYPYRGALVLETQHFPDSPNHPNFPSTELKPGQTLRSTTVFKFSAR